MLFFTLFPCWYKILPQIPPFILFIELNSFSIFGKQIKGLNGKTNQTQPEETKVPTPPPTAVKSEQAPSEPKIPQTKKETPSSSTIPVKSPLKKALSPTLNSTIDPLSLLEPTFFEETPVPLRFKEHSNTKKVLPKKMKKRKLSEQEPVINFKLSVGIYEI